MNKPHPDRETQRRMIMESEAYRTGKEFNVADVSQLLGVSNPAYILSTMADEGLLKIRRHPVGNQTFVMYSKPLPKFARIPMRKHTDAELGIVA